jgi:hypothetical protein
MNDLQPDQSPAAFIVYIFCLPCSLLVSANIPLSILTTLSLSTAIIQFIDFAAKLVFKSYKIYNAAEGALLEYSELDISVRKII